METGNTLTNRELLRAFDARLNSLSYVYDTFKWTHCEADGINFDDAWATMARTSNNRRAQFEGTGVPRSPLYSAFERKRAARMMKKNAQA